MDMVTTSHGAPEPRRTRGRPKDEDVADIEARLLGVALAEFLKHGYGATSVNMIVRAAGVSKTTIYSRFKSKEQLFRAIMDNQINQLSANAAIGVHRRRSGLEQGLRAYGNHTLRISLEGDLLNVNRLVYSESQRFPELGAAAAERTELGIRQVSAFISECADADQISCRHPDEAARAFIFMLRGWYVDVMLSNRKVLEEGIDEWVRSAVRMLLADRERW